MKQTNKIQSLIKSAKNKRESALSRTHQVLTELQPNKHIITFAQVAKLANVSSAWLYREREIREQIEQLRQRSIHDISGYKQQNLQEIERLKNKVKKLEAKNKNLQRQLNIVYGKLYQLSK